MARTGSPSLLPILRSETQAAVLTRLLLGPPRSRSVADIAADVGADTWSVRRELVRLQRAGILRRDTVGRALLFAADETSPLLEPLRTLLERSVGAVPSIVAALEGQDGIRSVLLFGSWARGQVHGSSDIDLLIIGDVDHRELTDALAEVERRTGREIDFTAMTVAEFDRRRSDGSGFLVDVLDRPHQVLVGALP